MSWDVSQLIWYWKVDDSSPGTQWWAGTRGIFVDPTADADALAFTAAGHFPTEIDTFVNLQKVINDYNILQLSGGQFYGAPQTFSILGGNITLTNPLSELTIINNPTGIGLVRTVSLPQMDVPGSIPKGVPFYIQVSTNDGAGHSPGINLRYTDGATPVTAGVAGDVIMLLLSDNSTTNGTVIPVILPFVPVQTLRGGLGTSTAPTDGQIPIGQGGNPKTYAPQTISGDATVADTGALTLASTVAAGGPTGDASHVAQITYDAKGRLTTVSSVAIAISDSAITYGNESANRVFSGPGSGGAAAPTFRALVGADLPNPSATTLGGIESLAAVSHKWINTISTSGVPSATQPDFTDISGTVAASQLNGMSSISNTLANDVALNNTGTFFDGPSIAQGTSGTWLVIGFVNVTDTSAAATFVVKLTDGTTDFAVVGQTIDVANQDTVVTLASIVTTPAGNLKMQVKDVTSTNGKIFGVSPGNATTKIVAIRIG